MDDDRIELDDGRAVLIRAIRTEDAEGLGDLYRSLEPQALLERFGGGRRPNPRELVARSQWSRTGQRMLVAIASGTEDDGAIVAELGYATIDATTADVGVTVREGWRHRGLARQLADRAIVLARADGVVRFQLEIAASNRAARELWMGFGGRLDRTAAGTATYLLDLPAQPRSGPASPDATDTGQPAAGPGGATAVVLRDGRVVTIGPAGERLADALRRHRDRPPRRLQIGVAAYAFLRRGRRARVPLGLGGAPGPDPYAVLAIDGGGEVVGHAIGDARGAVVDVAVRVDPTWPVEVGAALVKAMADLVRTAGHAMLLASVHRSDAAANALLAPLATSRRLTTEHAVYVIDLVRRDGPFTR